MFGNESDPSIVYTFRAKLEANNEEVLRQMFAAHKYRNDLVRIELDRRDAVDMCLVRHCSELERVVSAIGDIENKLEFAESEAKKERIKSKSKKKTPSKETVETLKSLRLQRKELFAKRKALRTSLFENPVVRAELDGIGADSEATKKERRKSCGVYWPTYLTVEQSLSGIRSGAPPRFRRWDGRGRIAVQLQGGMSADEAFSMADTRLRLEQIEPPQKTTRNGTALPARTGRRKGRVHRLWMRIGSTDDRKPVWATFIVKMQSRKGCQRPIPDDCQIKWAYVVQTRVARRKYYEAQFVLARKDGWAKPDSAPSGIVAVNAGWRSFEDGSMRVAYWCGNDGNSGELALPAKHVSGYDVVDNLQSVRDNSFNLIKQSLTLFVRRNTASLPEFMALGVSHIGQWRSPGKLIRLYSQWKDNRFAADADIFSEVEAWQKQENHLYEWQCFQALRLQRRRLDMYRVFAATLRRKYKTAVIADVDWTDFCQEGLVEDGDKMGNAMRRQRSIASPGILESCLKHSVSDVQPSKEKHLSGKCHVCGHINADADKSALIVECAGCKSSWDQDRNHCLNLLAPFKS